MNKHIQINKPGGTDQLYLVEEPTYLPKKYEVRIRVRSCGLNFSVERSHASAEHAGTNETSIGELALLP